jgi:hypothetical protein
LAHSVGLRNSPTEMTNTQEIQETLVEMSALLRYGEIEDWALALERLHREIPENPVATIVKIASMFAGMGSLNDLVLYKDGHALLTENVKLDELRSKLFTLCHP